MTNDLAIEQMAEQPVTMNTGKVPEKFIDPETGAVRIDALVNSYLELERKLSAMVPAPLIPNTPDEYEINISHGLFEADPEINQRLYEKKFTIEQVQEVYDLAAEKLVPMILELAGEFQADREVERLVSAFGGPEKWQEVSRQLLAYGKKNLPPQVLENLSSSFEGVMALYRMMKGGEQGFADVSDNMPSGEMDLQAMMRDPRYWKDRDPAFVAKVTEGFQRMYGE